ncbi:uncharacterized protein LOC100198541 [Hydra vulgaris]|uniref:Uncharacterized protein LOC100198541 n=1 Tax=Hydra vulgaris TaxID=6087 RepID=A0ABM4C3P6_HYDVU
MKHVLVKFVLVNFICLFLCEEDDEIKNHVTCDRDFLKIGCFRDLHDPTSHNLLITDKDEESDSYQGFDLDWDKMKESIHSIACRCSKKSKEEGYNFFYIIHWAECWSSKNLNELQDVNTVLQRSSKCYNADFLECDDDHIEECAGGSEETQSSVYLYKSFTNSNASEPAIDGGLTEWSEFSECSVECGTGTKERERTCTNPIPSGAGKDCIGELHEVVECVLDDCKIIPDSKNLTIEPSEPLIIKEENVITKSNLVATLKLLKKEYFVSFELNPSSFQKGWANVVHLTVGDNFLKYGDRNPAVWFHRDGSGRLLFCSAISGNRNRCKTTKSLQLNKWHSVMVVQKLLERLYIFEIYLNNENIFSEVNRDARDFANVKVYAADPWHRAQSGFIRNLHIANGKPDFFKFTNQLFTRGKLVTILKLMQKDYSVSFDLNPTSFSKGWKNVIHFTTGRNNVYYGDRNPGVWFHKSGTGSLHICSAISRNRNRCKNTYPLQSNKWHSIKILQTSYKGKYVYRVFINGKSVISEINNYARVFEEVKVYVSDPWYAPQSGFIKNLKIVNGNKEVAISL